MTRRRHLLPGGLACALVAGCASIGGGNYEWIGGGGSLRESHGALREAWRRELTPSERGAYRPVEHAVAAIDPIGGRVYVGARSGRLFAFSEHGQPLYRFELHESVEGEPALDVDRDELFVTTERGELLAFRASAGSLRWTAKTQGAVRRAPLLFRDALFVFSEEDVLEARSREDGSVLWSYKRDRGDGFLVAGHSALQLTDGGLLLAGFSDGTIVALDALDGRVKWERATSVDAPDAEPGRPRYLDVDTTPVMIDNHVYAASFAAGLYCLDANNGSVIWREPELTGITSLAALPDGAGLITVSADLGVSRFDTKTRIFAWTKGGERGSFGVPTLVGDLVLVGDSRGSLVALSAATGEERGRLDTGHGFVAGIAAAGARAYALSNGGNLLAIRLPVQD